MKYTAKEFLKTSADIAKHFGFRTAESFKKDPLCKDCEEKISFLENTAPLLLDLHCRSINSSVASFCTYNLHALNAPVLLYSIENNPDSEELAVNFNIFNVDKSIAEAILIQVGRSLLQELGGGESMVKINSLGDKDSSVRHLRELTNFLRKKIDHLPADARELLKIHPLKALAYLNQQGHDISFKAPNSLEYLSDQSRKHLREIIEYLDMTEIPYEIDPRMVDYHDYYSDTIFSIENRDEEESDEKKISIRGGRLNDFIFEKTNTLIPTANTVITMKSNKKTNFKSPTLKKSGSDIFLVQIGFGPKIRSLIVIDELRKINVAVQHKLSSDSLSEQLRQAEDAGARYTVIIGQKEFLNDTAILRDMKNRTQENLPLNSLFKKLKKATTNTN